ncbi:hypothetical protein [Leeuwenhoekiella parthenopeia]|uniref:CbiN domain protein n=1 Tax=Leeuwenhoekiella parthenopeia TaxID=2890320 RepID=A0ABS8GY47_9FLAO|nr:hypothetical protein [Leeuwenhoekiella parthenopeia]MCC4214743.1 hypothetical protein [Leeuwenhoekiella parthenopeia]
MKKTILITLSLIIFSLNGIYACSCIKVNIKNEFERSDLIFTGRLVDIVERTASDTIPLEGGKHYIREYRWKDFKFKVSEFIEGKNKTEFIIIASTAGGADCGINFDLNTDYLIYSSEIDFYLNSFGEGTKLKPYYTSSICTRTKTMKKTSKREIRKLKRLANRKE